MVTGVFAVAASTVGAVTAYHSAAPTAAHSATTEQRRHDARVAQQAAQATPTPSPLPERRTVVEVRYRACPRGYQLVRRECVRHRSRTVTVVDP